MANGASAIASANIAGRDPMDYHGSASELMIAGAFCFNILMGCGLPNMSFVEVKRGAKVQPDFHESQRVSIRLFAVEHRRPVYAGGARCQVDTNCGSNSGGLS